MGGRCRGGLSRRLATVARIPTHMPREWRDARESMKRILLNQLGLQAVWFSCVLGAAWGMAWVGPVAAAGWIAWHLRGCERAGRELALVLCAGGIGSTADAALLAWGGLIYRGHAGGPLGPVWIVALWMAFATTLNVSLVWLRGRPLLAAALGGVGGPLAYLAGRRLGAVAFGPPDTAPLTVLALVWSLSIVVLVQLAVHLDGAGAGGSRPASGGTRAAC